MYTTIYTFKLYEKVFVNISLFLVMSLNADTIPDAAVKREINNDCLNG